MFGAVSRFFSNFWEDTTTEACKNLANESEPKDEEFSANLTEKEIRKYDIPSNGAKFETHELRKVFTGKVTKLYDNSGLVDEEVHFTFDKVIGGIRPKLDCEVHIEASRTTAHDGWRADRVEVLASDWNDFGNEGTQEVLIGDITDINEKYLIVNYDVHCPTTCLAIGYVPCKGDWVRAEVIKDRGIVCDVKIIEPLRQKSLVGTVTSVGCGHGYIDAEIFFSFGSCKRNYVPRKGHTVIVTAIESNQGNSKWRAVKVEPKMPRREANNPNMARTAPIFTESKFMKKLLENKENIVINNSVNFGDITFDRMQDIVVSIRNDGTKCMVLKSVDGLVDESVFKLQLIEQGIAKDNLKAAVNDSGKQQFNVEISPRSSIEFKVTVESRLLGEFNQLVVFNFGDFQIGRYFAANVRDEQQQLLDARTPYHRRKFVDKKEALNRVLETRNNQQWVIPGERPMFKQKTINISTKLSQYEIPRTLRQYILNKMDLCCLIPSLAEPLSMRNYKERFSALLHAEEVQMELEMREFDLQQVSLKPSGEFLSLDVPGLAEGRPSLLIGDRVILCVSGRSHNSPKYEGFIHEVLSTEVLLKFHEDFHASYDMDSYDVMFFFNRTTLRRCHKAVETAKYLGEQVLFPSKVLPKLPRTVRELKKNNKGLFNPKLNERQRAAVSRILIGQSRPMPYVLFGPPGTGKTVTLVEAILQVFHRVRSSRILACTPSNSAADLIAERLHHSGGISEGDMVRLNAFQRQQNIPEDIENYSTNIEKLDVAAHYHIVICTCTTAGQLHTLGLAPGHFTHVIIDEAGQATEPESLVPISCLAGTEGQIILGGDPYQLGAVLRSSISQTYGLNISLLERLMTRSPYSRDESKYSDHGSYDPLAVTKLVNNYRSHEALLNLPSRLFYHAEMVPCAEEDVTNCLCAWDALPNKDGFPILFHGIKGEDLREGNSPSWFNAVEAVQVIRYVQDLRKYEKHPVKLTDIGIITPYRKQVEKIRLLLDRLGMSEIKVGSVEEFQGQERLVIIISTVRSQESLVGFDYTHNIGFLSNPKRFNVAITRAQALMIVVGNPHVLVKDTNWRALLRYCLDNNSYTGCDLPLLNEPDLCEDYDNSDELNIDKSEQDGHDEGISSTNRGLVNDLVHTSSDEENGHCFDKEVEKISNVFMGNCPARTLPAHHRNLSRSEFSSSVVTRQDEKCQDRSGKDAQIQQWTTSAVVVKSTAAGQVFTEDHLESKDNTGGIPMDKLDTKSIDKTKRDTGGVFMDKLGMVGSNGDTVGIHVDKLGIDGSEGDTGGTSMDKLHAKNADSRKGNNVDVSGNNSDLRCEDGVYRENKNIHGSSMDNLNRKHDCVISRDSVPKRNEGKLNGCPTKDNEVSNAGQTLHSSQLISGISLSNKEDQIEREIHCFDNQTPTLPVPAGCDDINQFYESSDDDIEEIVYKGYIT